MLNISQPLYKLLLISVNIQSIEWPPKTSNREEKWLLGQFSEATGGKSNPIRQEDFAWASDILYKAVLYICDEKDEVGGDVIEETAAAGEEIH